MVKVGEGPFPFSAEKMAHFRHRLPQGPLLLIVAGAPVAADHPHVLDLPQVDAMLCRNFPHAQRLIGNDAADDHFRGRFFKGIIRNVHEQGHQLRRPADLIVCDTFLLINGKEMQLRIVVRDHDRICNIHLFLIQFHRLLPHGDRGILFPQEQFRDFLVVPVRGLGPLPLRHQVSFLAEQKERAVKAVADDLQHAADGSHPFRELGNALQDLRNKVQVLFLAAQKRVHHIVDRLSIAEVKAVKRHTDQRQVDLVSRFDQPLIQIRHEDPHIVQDDGADPDLLHAADDGALGGHIVLDGGKGCDAHFMVQEQV